MIIFFSISAISENAFRGLDKLRYVHLEHNRLSTLKIDWLKGTFTQFIQNFIVFSSCW